MSLATMATRSNFSTGYLCNIEKGRRTATTDVIAAYRNILGDDLHRLALLAVLSDAEPTIEGDDIVDILNRIERLGTSVDNRLVQHFKSITDAFVARYESLNHSTITPVLLRQRRHIESLLDESNRTSQRRELFEAAGGTSGVLGYIAVGRGEFQLARAYCAEAILLGELAQSTNLQAWARGLQSFCEYYAKDYRTALEFARDGLALAGDGPQSVRLMVNGVARALGKLGDVDGVHRAVNGAHELMSRNTVPLGLPSSITLHCYSATQVASNATTAYVALALPDSAREYADRALPVIEEAGSPWSRSLILIDLAIAQVLSSGADLDSATNAVLRAINITGSKPVISVTQRTREFLDHVDQRWPGTSRVEPLREAARIMGVS
jgi:tetratricopeptide (TPR) repeat protein